MDDAERALRDQLTRLLDGGMAHMTFDQAIADFPLDRINERPPNVPYTPWHILEHLRITQWDILDFMRNPDYKEIAWPDDYWPAPDAVTDDAGWARTIAAFHADLAAIRAITTDPQTDLYTPYPWGEGQNTLREILLVADHNSHHIGEFAILRQVMSTWPPSHS
jgi:uncharacterized damage-inducible protein DinB